MLESPKNYRTVVAETADIGKHLVPIPSRFVKQLKEAEETGIGYQVVGIKLKDERSFDQDA